MPEHPVAADAARSSSDVARTGFLDLHSHLIPGIDDGCVAMEDSLDCVRRLIAAGFCGTVCTPHMCTEPYPWLTLESASGPLDALRRAIDQAGLNYPLWLGGELRIAAGTIEWLEKNGVPTLGLGRSVLIDYWGSDWPNYGDQLIEYLFAHDYQPILAHPERMPFFDEPLEELLNKLRERAGVWLQGNLRCIAGNEGPIPQQRMTRWLAAGRYDLIATDMHGPRCLDDRLAGLPVVDQQCSTEGLKQLLSQRPREIVFA